MAGEVTDPKEGSSYSFLNKCTYYQTEFSIFMFIHVEHIDSAIPKPWPEKFLSVVVSS